MSGSVPCPLCGMQIDAADAAEVEANMERDYASCPRCGRCYWEARTEDVEGGEP